MHIKISRDMTFSIIHNFVEASQGGGCGVQVHSFSYLGIATLWEYAN